MEEKEIKVQLSKAKFEDLLAKFQKSSRTEKEEQKDVYYDNELLKINNLNRGLRIRHKNKKAVSLEFKSLFYNRFTRKDNPWFIEEVAMHIPMKKSSVSKLNRVLRRLGFEEVRIKEGSGLEEIVSSFEGIGLVDRITVTKIRTSFEDEDVSYVFDSIKELGYFLEIESKGKVDPLSKIELLLQEDEYTFIRNGYNDMVAKNIENYLSNEEKQLLFKINPDWNILASELKLVKDLLTEYKDQ